MGKERQIGSSRVRYIIGRYQPNERANESPSVMLRPTVFLCMALSDPTVGAYALTKELNLLAQTDPRAVAYFCSAGVAVTLLPLDSGSTLIL